MCGCWTTAQHSKMNSGGRGTDRWTSFGTHTISAITLEVLFRLSRVLALFAFCAQSVNAQAPTLDFATSTPAGSVTVTQGSSSFLICSFSSTRGTPVVAFTWTAHPGMHQVIRTSNNSATTAQQTAVLLLQWPTLSSSGQYVCTARNSVGPSSISWYVDVVDPGSILAPSTPPTTSTGPFGYENSTTSQPSNGTTDARTALQFPEGTTILTALATFDAIAVALLLYVLCCAPKRMDDVERADDETTAAAAESVEASRSASKNQPPGQSDVTGPKEQRREYLELIETRTVTDIQATRSISLPAGRTQDRAPTQHPAPSRASKGKKPASPLTRRSSKHQQPPSALNHSPGAAVPGTLDAVVTQAQYAASPEPREVEGYVLGNPSTGTSNTASGDIMAQALGGEFDVVRTNPLFADDDELQFTPIGGNKKAPPVRRATLPSAQGASVPFTSAMSTGQLMSGSASRQSIASTVTSDLSPQDNDVFFTAAKHTYYTMPSYNSQLDVASLNELRSVREWASGDMTDSRGSRQQQAKCLTPSDRRPSALSLPIGRPAASVEGLSRVLQNLP